MDRIFQIGDFRFRISYPEEVAPPDNFMKFLNEKAATEIYT